MGTQRTRTGSPRPYPLYLMDRSRRDQVGSLSELWEQHRVWKWIETAPSATVTGWLSERDSSELSSRFFIESPLLISIPSPSRLHPHILSFLPHLHLCLIPSSHSLQYHYHFAVALARNQREKERASKLEAKPLLRPIGVQDQRNQRFPTSSWPRSSP